ncbi:MAG TPA: hypothetical protein DCS09_11810 [Porphyromonadaceae bacterium]|nr:hypothetical protein [Porphyromonadaceae bacterium]
MSLVKDVQTALFVTSGFNSGAPGLPAYRTNEEITLSASQTAYGQPHVEGVDVDGEDDSVSGRLIRVSTSAEKALMREGLFGNYIGLVQFYKLGQLQKYYTDYGVPIFLLPNGAYISMWWFSFGPAFGTFIGYDPNNPPRQYVKLKLSPLGVILPELVE